MEFPVGNIVTAIATVLAVVIANRLTFTRSSREKIWDLRRQAYGVIVSEIAAIERINSYADAMMAEDHFGYFDSKQRTVHEERIGEHWKAAADRFSSDYLVLSDEFIALFEKLDAETNDDDPNESWPEEKERLSEAIKKARPLLTAQARSEIAKQPRWWWSRFGSAD